ncbi:hypothetical protein [Halobacillus karajensis]|nr:hypothetical protein [Halobacillus karajensis]
MLVKEIYRRKMLASWKTWLFPTGMKYWCWKRTMSRKVPSILPIDHLLS